MAKKSCMGLVGSWVCVVLGAKDMKSVLPIKHGGIYKYECQCSSASSDFDT